MNPRMHDWRLQQTVDAAAAIDQPHLKLSYSRCSVYASDSLVCDARTTAPIGHTTRTCCSKI